MATDSNRPSAMNEGASSGRTKEVMEEARGTASELKNEVRDQARTTTGYVREQARSSVEDGKKQVAHQIGGLAKAFERSGEELRSQEMGRLAEQSEWLAGRVDELQHYLEDRSASELLNDLRSFARRQPGWFLGGMFAAGLVTARFLHSSDRDHHRETHSYGGGFDDKTL